MAKRLTQAKLAVKNPGFPTTREREYRRMLNRRVRAMALVMNRAIEKTLERFALEFEQGERRDATPAQIIMAILRVVGRVEDVFDETFPVDLRGLAEQARLTDLFAAARDSQLGNRIFGIRVLDPANNEALYAEFARIQAEQIRNMQAKYFESVRKLSIQAVADGTSTRDLRAQIMAQTGVSRSRAQFLARNSIGTLNGLITQKRQTDLGVTQYIWRTSKDPRVRPEHAAREGVTFDWSEPPEDGHPGEPFNCRCTAEAVLPDF